MDSLTAMKSAIDGMIINHPTIVLIMMVILVILVIAMYFGLFSSEEPLRTCMSGSASQLCKQSRDGVGESLTSSAIAQGYDADASAFCSGAGQPTNDPRDYLLHASKESELFSVADQFDKNLVIGMQH